MAVKRLPVIWSQWKDEILSRSSQVEKIDTVARRTFELDNAEKGTGTLNLNVLCGGRALVQIAAGTTQRPVTF
jgi:hypothetical protein